MAVYDRSYTRWEGDRDSRVDGISTIAGAGVRQGVANFFRRKLPAVLITLMSFSVFLGGMLVILGRYWVMTNPDLANTEFAQELFASDEFNRMTQVNGVNMYRFMIISQAVWAGIACIAMGSGLIANDRRTNALEMYLSRPVTLWQYLLGKFWAVGFFVALVTLIPATVLVLTQMSVSVGIEGELERLMHVLWRVVAAGAVVVAVPSLLVLAMSSLAKQARSAAIMLLAWIFVLDAVLAQALQDAFGDDRYFMISILFNIKQVAAWALQADEYLALDIPPVQSLYILAGWCVLCLMIIRRRVRPVEVVA